MRTSAECTLEWCTFCMVWEIYYIVRASTLAILLKMIFLQINLVYFAVHVLLNEVELCEKYSRTYI